jgi:hypothetical protein
MEFKYCYGPALKKACIENYRPAIDFLLDKIGNDIDQLNCGLWGSCIGGHIGLANLMIQKGATILNGGLWGACQGGHKELVDLMIQKGATDWDWGLEGACEGGHTELVDLMIYRGAINWNRGLGGACLGGHKELVDLMIQRIEAQLGATHWNGGFVMRAKEVI